MKSNKLLAFVFSILIGITVAKAQDPLDPTFETGQKLFGSYHGGQIDASSLPQGGLTVDIPLISYPQRGGKLKLQFVLHYHEQGLYSDNVCGQAGCNSVTSGYLHGFSVIETGAGVSAGLGGVTCPKQIAVGRYDCNANVYEPNGAVHLMQPIGHTTWQAVDASGYRLDTAPGALPGSSWYYVTGPDGTRYSFGGANSSTSVVEDTNGNQIVISGPPGFQNSWTDTMGRYIPSQPAEFTAAYGSGSSGDTTGCTGPLPTGFAFTWNPPGLNGGTYPIKFCYAAVTETLPPLPNLIGPQSYSVPDLQSVVLPDGRAWRVISSTRALAGRHSLFTIRKTASPAPLATPTPTTPMATAWPRLRRLHRRLPPVERCTGTCLRGSWPRAICLEI